ncbi:hypothetical protein [Actinokineospora iranica]|uniref:hypothetical protein n=1 Tax=Actinokineospora iranica TaxID=1271860 RepID=UPI0011134986|nr:hypothetical protein [Actinokineospora iranica]
MNGEIPHYSIVAVGCDHIEYRGPAKITTRDTGINWVCDDARVHLVRWTNIWAAEGFDCVPLMRED